MLDTGALVWPGEEWELGGPPSGVGEVFDEIVARWAAAPETYGQHQALLAVCGGRIVAESYGAGVDAGTTLISWSMAKSVTQALVGVAVRDGLLSIDEPAPVAAWAGDERRSITMRHLLEMRSGLRFNEDYVGDVNLSHCLEMLFGEGQHDMAAYAASLPLDHQPGSVWNYSSGTTNIICRILGDAIGGGADAMAAWMQRELLGPLAMGSADPRFDTAGTFVGSSYLYATARDFARFGLLYLRGGRWGQHRLLPDGWVHSAAALTADEPTEAFGYGSHWWCWRHPAGVFSANGYECQRTIVAPDRDLVVVRLGKSPIELRPAVDADLLRLVEAFPTL